MNPRLRIVTQEGRAKYSFLGLIRERTPLQPFNAYMIVVVDAKPTKIFADWFAASFPTVTPFDIAEEITDGEGYPTRYFLERWAEIE